MSFKPIQTALLVALALLLAAGPASAIEKATIVLQWLPQAQFAGFYMAKDKGFYKEEGVYLHIIPGGPDSQASEFLESGRADFVTMFLSTGLQKRVAMPLVNIGQIVQHSALMLVTKKSSGIRSIEDLKGQKVGLWANEFQIQPRALFRQMGMKVTVIPQSDSLDLFMRDGVTAASAMWYNEYHTLLTYGLDEDDLQAFFYNQYNLNFPEDGIYCLEETRQKRPELCQKVVAATIKGWEYAFEHPEEAVNAVMKRMKEFGVPANRAHQRWMLKRMRDIIRSDYAPMGYLRKEDYERVKEVLIDTDFIDKAPTYEEFFQGVAQ